MKLEHYLASVATSIEAHEAEISEAFEHYARELKGRTTTNQGVVDTLDAEFLARLANSYLAALDRINNLRKWPRT